MALCTAILCLVLAGLYLARFDSVIKYQNASSKPDWVVYDTACYNKGYYAKAAVRVNDDIDNLDLSVTAVQSLSAMSDDLWTDKD